MSTEEYLVYGYIREIQLLLQNKQTIPDAVYSICCSFYMNLIAILWKKTVRPKKCNITFGVLNIDNKSTSTINTNTFESSGYEKGFVNGSLCHIPNISQYLPNDMTNGSNFNGIFACFDEGTVDYGYMSHGSTIALSSYPSLILYESYNNNGEAKYEYKSASSIDCRPRQCIYCKDQQIVLYEFGGKLYQLDLNNIKTENDLSNFQAIKQNKQRWKLQTLTTQATCLNMTYLPNKSSIFTILNDYALISLDIAWKCMPFTRKMDCGIFNFDNNSWTDIKPFEYTSDGNDSFNSVNCYDGNNNIYLVHYKTGTSVYDGHKDNWNIICNKHMYPPGTIWFDNNMLYAIQANPFKLMCLDLRSDKKSWISNVISFDGMVTTDTPVFTFFQ